MQCMHLRKKWGSVVAIEQWSRFYKFWEVYEYHGHFDESGESGRKKLSLRATKECLIPMVVFA